MPGLQNVTESGSAIRELRLAPVFSNPCAQFMTMNSYHILALTLSWSASMWAKQGVLSIIVLSDNGLTEVISTTQTLPESTTTFNVRNSDIIQRKIVHLAHHLKICHETERYN